MALYDAEKPSKQMTRVRNRARARGVQAWGGGKYYVTDSMKMGMNSDGKSYISIGNGNVKYENKSLQPPCTVV